MFRAGLKLGDWVLAASGLLTITVVAIFDGAIQQHYQFWRLGLFALIAGLFTLMALMEISLFVGRWLLGLFAVLAFALFASFSWDALLILLVVWAALLPEVTSRYSWLLLLLINGLFAGYWYFLSEQRFGGFTLLSFVGFQMFALASSEARKELRASKESLESINIELQATQALLAQQSKQQERLRIGRDLHDSIGHHLTALSLQLEHAKHQPPDHWQDWAGDLGRQVKDTLGELRQIVKAMRNDEQIDLANVCARLQGALPEGIVISYPEPFEIAEPELAEQLVFCLQEAISNALRHGAASRVNVELVSSTPLAIRIANNGRRSVSWQAGSGLLGMRERLQPYGGQVQLSPTAAGMQLDLIVGETALG
ncbi:MAG: histidine kinase [Cellvibrionaceae bacterium]|nr:histidine kinase [Cellvibrionaceae bacterium]MCV6626639.1 histidine kinase [Cellvibrionaceae bacterium]